MDKVQKILTYVIFAIAAVSVLLWYNISSIETESLTPEDVDSFYFLTGFMLFATIGVTVIAMLVQLFSDMAKLKQAALLLVAVGIIVFISYSLASDASVEFLGEVLTKSAVESKWVGTGLYTTYITGALAILSIVFSPVIKLLK